MVNQQQATANQPYRPIHRIQDSQPVRAVCFHPRGDVYVVGSNSRKLRICHYPDEDELKLFTNLSEPIEPRYSFQFLQIHRSSVYCAAFNQSGNLLATGSNDQTVHVVQYDSEKHLPKSNEYKLTSHTGTIRDLIFMPNEENEGASSFLVTAGAGENEIIVTDCNEMKTVRVLRGHDSTVMSLHHWNDNNMFVSGSLDGTIKLWDVRSKLCCSTISLRNNNSAFGGDQVGGTIQATVNGNSNSNSDNNGTSEQQQQQANGHTTTLSTKTPICVVRVEETGKLIATGHKDGTCMLIDRRTGGKVIQSFKAHDDEIRTLNFSPKTFYLLTASYDRKIKLMDLQGDLTKKLPCVEIGELGDKVVQTAWHPTEYNFVTTCADGTATLWVTPETIAPSSSSPDGCADSMVEEEKD